MTTGIITQGIGPSATIELFLLLGLEAPAAVTAPTWRTYDTAATSRSYSAKGAGRQHAAKDASRTHEADRQG